MLCVGPVLDVTCLVCGNSLICLNYSGSDRRARAQAGRSFTYVSHIDSFKVNSQKVKA